MIKSTTNQEDWVILNVYACNNKASNYETETDRPKRRNRHFSVIMDYFNIPPFNNSQNISTEDIDFFKRRIFLITLSITADTYTDD